MALLIRFESEITPAAPPFRALHPNRDVDPQVSVALCLALAFACLQCISAAGNVGLQYNVELSKMAIYEQNAPTQFPSNRALQATGLAPAGTAYDPLGADRAQLFTATGDYGYFVDIGVGGAERTLRRFRMPTASGNEPGKLRIQAEYSYNLLAGAPAGAVIQFIQAAPAACAGLGGYANYIVVGYTGVTDGFIRLYPTEVQKTNGTLGYFQNSSGRNQINFGATPKAQALTGFPTAGTLAAGNPLFYIPSPDGTCSAIITTRDAVIYGTTAGAAVAQGAAVPQAIKTSLPVGTTQTTDAVTMVDLRTLSITKIQHVWDHYPSLIPSNADSTASMTTANNAAFVTMPSTRLSPHAVLTDDGSSVFLATQVVPANDASATYTIVRGATFTGITNASPSTARLLKFDVKSFALTGSQKLTTTKAAPVSGDPPFISQAPYIYLAFTEKVTNNPSGSITERAKVYAWFPLALVYDATRTAAASVPSAILKLDAETLAMEGVQAATPATIGNSYASSFSPFPVFFGLPYTSDAVYAYRHTASATGSAVIASAARGLGFVDGAGTPFMTNSQLQRQFTSTDMTVGDVVTNQVSETTNMPVPSSISTLANLNSNPLNGEYPWGSTIVKSRAVDTTIAFDQYKLTAFVIVADGATTTPGTPGGMKLLTYTYSVLSPCPGGGYQDFCDYLVDPVYERTGYAFGATMAGFIGISLLDNFLGYREAHKYGASILEPGTIGAIDLSGGPAVFPTSSLRPGGHILQFANHLQHVPVTGLAAPHYPASYASFTRANGWALGHFPLPWYYSKGNQGGPLRPTRYDLTVPGRTRNLLSLMTYVGDFRAYSMASTLVQSNLFYGMLTIAFVLIVQGILYFVYRGVATRDHKLQPTIRWPRPLMATLVWIYGGFVVSLATVTRQGENEWRWASAFMLFFVAFLPMVIVALLVFWYLRINKLVVFLKRAKPYRAEGGFVQKQARACWHAFRPSNIAAVLTGQRVVGDWVGAEYFSDGPIASFIKPSTFRDWFGIFYEDYKFDWLSFLYGVFDLARKFFIGATIGLLIYYPDKSEVYVQLASFIVFHAFLLLYIAIIRPWRDPAFNIMDFFTTLGHLLSYVLILVLQRNTEGNRDRLAIGLVILQWAVLGVQLLIALINRYIGRRWYRAFVGAHEAAAPHYARPEYQDVPRQPSYGPAPTYRDNAPNAKTIQL
eukprot:tig00000430_g634.t1